MEARKANGLIWFSSRYAALQAAYEAFIKVGVPAEDMAFIPQPVDSIPSVAEERYSFHCPRLGLRELAIQRGVDPVQLACFGCEKKKSCRLHQSKGEAPDKTIVLLHSSYLRQTNSKSNIDELVMDRHVILDEYMDDDLLGVESFSLSELAIYKQVLARLDMTGTAAGENPSVLGRHLNIQRSIVEDLLERLELVKPMVQEPSVLTVGDLFRKYGRWNPNSKLQKILGMQVIKELAG